MVVLGGCFRVYYIVYWVFLFLVVFLLDNSSFKFYVSLYIVGFIKYYLFYFY